MRVISGKYRGKRLLSPSDNDVRPTSDMVKESIFGMIQFDIVDSVFIDLFSGSGAMGIEAISRGASEVVFVDFSRKSIELIKKNIALVGIKENNGYTILNDDYSGAIKKLCGKKADFIFLDPPYKDKPLEDILMLVEKYDILNESGLIIYEHLYIDKITVSNEKFEIKKSKKYGNIGIEVIQKR